MSFERSTIREFVFRSYCFEPSSAELSLRYALDSYEFVEVIRFVRGRKAFSKPELAALDRCFRLTHLLAGISYFKAAVPAAIRVETGDLSPAMAEFLNAVYRNGLGEFAYQNGLSLHQRQFFEAAASAPNSAPASAPASALAVASVELANHAVVPLGGGKDSLVSVELLRAAGLPTRSIAVGQSRLIVEVSEQTGLEHVGIERQLDRQLFELNQQGAYNGHVPISAILASVMLCGAIIYGYDAIVMSNENSAEIGNLRLPDGFEVNHQYSKTLEFEADFSALVNAEVLPGLRYFSLLRAWSELAIARLFAKQQRYDPVFSSCNRNFQIQGQSQERATDRWCRDCAKCRFVFLALAPFMSRQRLLDIFGGNMLADPKQLTGFRELLGLSGHKPFECVGEVGECRSALKVLTTRDDWSDCTQMSELVAMLPADTPTIEYWLQRGRHRIPDQFLSLLDAA